MFETRLDSAAKAEAHPVCLAYLAQDYDRIQCPLITLQLQRMTDIRPNSRNPRCHSMPTLGLFPAAMAALRRGRSGERCRGIGSPRPPGFGRPENDIVRSCRFTSDHRLSCRRDGQQCPLVSNLFISRGSPGPLSDPLRSDHQLVCARCFRLNLRRAQLGADEVRFSVISGPSSIDVRPAAPAWHRQHWQMAQRRQV